MFQITSVKLDSKVHRRYSDFDKLRLHLVEKYSNRLIPALPEKQLTDLELEKRRQGLARFLRMMARHQVMSKDELYIRFMTEKKLSIQPLMQELFDATPDEISLQTIENLPKVDKSVLVSHRSRMRTMLHLVGKLTECIEKQQKREADQSIDFSTMAHVLTSLDQKDLDDVAENFKNIAAEGTKKIKNQQETVMERLEQVVVALAGHIEMCERIGTKFDSEPPLSRTSSLRSRLQSAVKTPSAEALLKQEEEHEKQNKFAMYCLREETNHAEHYLQLLPSILLQFAHVGSSNFTNIANHFNKIIRNESSQLNSS